MSEEVDVDDPFHLVNGRRQAVSQVSNTGIGAEDVDGPELGFGCPDQFVHGLRLGDICRKRRPSNALRHPLGPRLVRVSDRDPGPLTG
jgi:hypothetical protein